MRHRPLAALVVAAIWVLFIAAPIAQAQYTQGLPPGIINVEVDGQPIDSQSVPVTNMATPEISGRVDLGVAAIELAVAAGDVIRFAAELDDRGRFRATVPRSLSDGQYTLYISDILIGAFAIEGAVPTEREPGKLLDIARVVPYPADFGESLPGIGFLDGRFFSIEDEARRSAAGGDDAPGESLRRIQRSLAEAGWLQRYESRLASPNPDDPAAFAVQVSSFVVEYASGADARTAFAAVAGVETDTGFPTIGNESTLTMLAGAAPDTGAEYQAARLVYRLGPMLGVIVYADFRNQQPDLDLLGSVAQAVAARGVAIADRQTLPLGSMTLRLDASAAVGSLARRDLYEVRGEQLTAVYNEGDAQQAAREALLAGTTDVFSSTTSGTFAAGRDREENRDNPAASDTESESESESGAGPSAPTPVIGVEPQASPVENAATPPVPPSESAGERAPADRPTAQLFVMSTLYEFPGESEADAWFARQQDLLLDEGQSGNATYRALDDAPALGNVSVTFASERPNGEQAESVRGFRLYARQGPIVAVIEVGSIPDLPLQAATGLMEQQLACITSQGCSGPASLPGSLFGDRAEAVANTEASVGQQGSATPEAALDILGAQAGRTAHNADRAVIGEAAAGVTQTLTRFQDLAHANGGFRVGRRVRMIFERQPPKRGLDDVGIGSRVNLQDLVERALAVLLDRAHAHGLEPRGHLGFGQKLVDDHLAHVRRHGKALHARSALQHHLVTERNRGDGIEGDLAFGVKYGKRARELATLARQQDKTPRLQIVLGAQAVE